MHGIFERILMSERISAADWRATIHAINNKSKEFRTLDPKVKVGYRPGVDILSCLLLMFSDSCLC
jgi:hypothetical protein